MESLITTTPPLLVISFFRSKADYSAQPQDGSPLSNSLPCVCIIIIIIIISRCRKSAFLRTLIGPRAVRRSRAYNYNYNKFISRPKGLFRANLQIM